MNAKVNKRSLMKRAWVLAEQLAESSNCKVKTFFREALKAAWMEILHPEYADSVWAAQTVKCTFQKKVNSGQAKIKQDIEMTQGAMKRFERAVSCVADLENTVIPAIKAAITTGAMRNNLDARKLQLYPLVVKQQLADFLTQPSVYLNGGDRR